MIRLTWLDLSCLTNGTRLMFAEDMDIYPDCIVPAGTACTVQDNGLNEIYCAMLVLPDDEGLRQALSAWGGCVDMGRHLNPEADINNPSSEWNQPSPLALPVRGPVISNAIEEGNR